ncbi:hypothetical protein ABMC88_10670 [Sulfitobacter sp. HNIBRBA2951]|uniref:hypothetical protein n=1 Tax=Sulfitobacter aquimarinus TaxID=3158557 RepID=UPI0032E02CB9
MTRKRMILLTGIALLTTLALVETATRSDAVLPATVAAITSTPQNAGPDTWQMDVTLADGTRAQIDYAGIRPNRAVGDAICVIEKKRSWAGAKYLVSSQITC